MMDRANVMERSARFGAPHGAMPAATRIPGRRIDLDAGMLWKSDGGCAVRIAVVKGTVWVTEEGDRDDHIVAAGEEMILPARGIVVVEALDDAAAIAVIEAVPD